MQQKYQHVPQNQGQMQNSVMINQVAPIPNQMQMAGGFQNPNQMAQMMPKFTFKQMIESFAGIFIKQKFELLEVITGCETKNQYYVYERGQDGTKFGKKIMKCKESSGCCSRNCMSGDCRPFKMKCTNLFNDNKMCLEMVRECACTIMCCNRPEMKVYYTEEGNSVYLGKVIDLFRCCDFAFEVQDENNKAAYQILASCCQCGLCCKGCPCDSCQKVIFELWKGKKESKSPVDLVKTGQSCLKSLVSDANNFSVPFAAGSSFKDRALLLAATLLIDYRMFEEKGGSNTINSNLQVLPA